MPVTPTYPGVYVQEIPSGVRTIAGVATSIGMFIGMSKNGASQIWTTRHATGFLIGRAWPPRFGQGWMSMEQHGL